MDRSKSSTDLLAMAFMSPNLAKHDIQFQIGYDLGSDHLPIEVSIDAPPHRNSSINHTKYKFDQTDREIFESTLEAALGSTDFTGFTFTGNLDKYADFILTAVSTAVDKAIPKSKSMRSESNPISDETMVLIKEKRRLRRQYFQNKNPTVKMHINELQKQVNDERRVETQLVGKICNSVSLETKPSESWCKIRNFLKYFYPPARPDDYRFDVGNEHELVEDVDA